jgi:thiamine transporter
MDDAQLDGVAPPMKSERVRVIVEIALCVSLSAVLNMPGLRFKLPFNIAGGTVSLNMLPILVLALRRGLGPGLAAGALYGLVDVLVDPFVVHPAQFLLDYPVAYGFVGVAGLGSRTWHRLVRDGHVLMSGAVATPFVVLAGAARFVSHWLSGLIFFASYAKGQPAWLYSLVYNASYLVPSLLLSAVACLALLPVLERAVPSSGRAYGREGAGRRPTGRANGSPR